MYQRAPALERAAGRLLRIFVTANIRRIAGFAKNRQVRWFNALAGYRLDRCLGTIFSQKPGSARAKAALSIRTGSKAR
jgi:hypothetical protein